MKSIYNIIFFNFIFIFTLGAQCFDADESIWLDPWASCETSPNPKSEYGNSHWIRYDFGEIRNLSKTWVWNTNDPSKLNQGFNQVKIDYSEDGSNWIYWGEMNFPMAQGEAIYSGFSGPDMFGIKARYVLLTAISNHGDPSCAGITEIKFNLYPELIEGVYNDSVLVCDEGFEEGVYIYDISNTSAGFEWPFDVGPGLSFSFEYRIAGESEWNVISELEEQDLFLEFLSPGTNYEIRVIADCNGEIIISDIQSFITLDGELGCDPVDNIWLVEATENTAEIAWDAVGDEDFYIIRYGLASESLLDEDDETESTEIFLDDLTPFTEYALRVGVFCDDDQLVYSEEFRFMTGLTSTEEAIAQKNTLRLFPNPSPGRFSIEYFSETTDQLIYSISDVTGKVLQSNDLRVAQGINIHRVDLSSLPDGVYLIHTQAQVSGVSISKRIIKL